MPQPTIYANAMHPDDDQLTALLFAEASEDVREHVRMCSFCQSRLMEMAEFDAAMEALAQRSTCPTPERLAQYAEGRLAGPDQARIQTHLQTCSYCQEELAVIQQYADVPIQEEQEGWWAAVTQGVRRWLQARPLFEPTLQPARWGKGEVQTWRYHTESFDVVLTSMPVDEGRVDWEGAIVPLTSDRISMPGGFRGRVLLDRGDGVLEAIAAIEPNGSFFLSALPQGYHHLFLEIEPDILIEINVT